MLWIKQEVQPGEMRGDIETRSEFVDRNVQWWWINRKFERVRRKQYYERFLDFGNIQTDNTIHLAEVGPGPLGGMLEVCGLPAAHKIFVDYIMEDLFNLKFIAWPEEATYVAAPAENLPLLDNYCDMLLSYNTLDHGWDVYKAISECVRVSKRCYLAFDCRGDSVEEVAIRQNKPDKDHHQLLKFEDISQFVFEQGMKSGQDEVWSIRDMDFKKFPVAFIEVEKC
jgi:hypothetical protein